MPVELSDYRNFLHLAETLHFARSARGLGMSASALTRCIQRLEEELGEPLFIRDKRNVRLSRAGELLRGHAQDQLDAHGRLLERLRAEHADPTGELRLACTVTACHSVLPDLLARCRSRYPGIQLRLTTSDASRSLQQLHAGEVDVAVVPLSEERHPGLPTLQLAHTSLCFIAPANDPGLLPANSSVDWSQVPMILPQRGLERERMDAWLGELGVTPNIYAEVNGNEAIIAMVSLGCGVGLVPDLVRQGSPLREAIRVVQVPHPPEGFAVGLCTQSRNLQRRVLEAFWQLAQQGDAAHCE